ncbi:hypothetical protein [Chromobacterium violaceum]|uniref:hypothetical protein n=1 Tax=Chromobacterium violaceum TaxID=536 RepID=UPI001B326A39|nr:hypothetical protein [Chromobacterium violaceum]MBP4047746.1 hypothetical protein [Chromobacterium violaceum]
MSIDLNNFAESAADAWEELTSTQTSRTGHTAARVASALANGVDPEVIALQMTKNSRKNNPDSPVTFTAAEMPTIAKLHAANKTRPPLTKQQTGALIREQDIADTEGDLGLAS